ncbi:hypothetical protein XENOCAPTIV_030542 [Xenoophorus captivus]|uniref:Nucleolar protein 12 n=1 Tax=Xenoophorus captivus TaxID=1517983 RepID=A0ABV0RWR5_9TELE
MTQQLLSLNNVVFFIRFMFWFFLSSVRDYLTGFHKRKLERRKAAVVELKKKIKEEQNRVREERHKEYVKMLKEREEALADAEDELEDAVISTTESVQYDHPNHTVTVTTISDLDLSGPHLLGPAASDVNVLSIAEILVIIVRSLTQIGF